MSSTVSDGPVGVPGHDGADQVAGRVGHPVGEERLVEMGVWLRGRGQQQVAVEVDGRSAGVGDRGSADRGDRARPHSTSRRSTVSRTVGERRRHRRRHAAQAARTGSGRRSMGSPRRGNTSSATRCICSSISSRRQARVVEEEADVLSGRAGRARSRWRRRRRRSSRRPGSSARSSPRPSGWKSKGTFDRPGCR